MTTSDSKSADLKRIAVIGCGHVGATSAYAILLSGIAEEIVILDKDRKKLRGEVMDLQHSVPLARPTRIRAGDFEDLKHADIAVIAAGAGTKPGESILELLHKNASVTGDIVEEIARSEFDGIILMTTNPVDILAQVAREKSDFPAAKVISSGTVLDTARLRMMLAEKLGIEARSIHAYIIGEHGDSEIAAWSAATIAGVSLTEYAEEFDLDFDEILEQVRNAAPAIVRHKGYTSTAIASSVVRICEAILRDEKTVLPVSTMTTGQYGIEGVYLSLPCVVGRGGVEKVIEISLDEKERAGLRKSAEVLRKTLRKIQK